MDEVEGSYKAAGTFGLPKSFTLYHGRLLDLCMMVAGVIPDETMELAPPRLEQNGEILTRNDLKSLATMAEMEFVASLEHELSGTRCSDDDAQAEPHVFDVFLMKSTFDRNHGTSSRQMNARPIAVCVPFRKQLMWWNGISRDNGGQLWPLSPSSHVRKISSLSGSARVLQALETALYIGSHTKDSEGFESTNLVTAGMKREQILHIDPCLDQTPLRPGCQLNKAQARAVQALSVFHSGFFCIQGPPGCGKTTTMVEMILAATASSSVIVVAPSNAAVANVALKLFETGLVPFRRMMVYGDNCHESVRFLNPKHRSLKYTQFHEAHEKELEVAPGQEPTPQQITLAKKLLNDLVGWLHLPGKEKVEEWTLMEVKAQCPVLPLKEDGSFSEEAKAILGDLMREADVVFSTLNSAGSFTLQSALTQKSKKPSFETLMLDKGGQCTEAEFFIATTFPRIRRVVVMGDPKQLKPTVISPICAANSFGDSFLGQVYKRDKCNLHLLDTQYRMDPIILRFPNTQFYGGKIRSGENVYDRQPKVVNPFLFEDTARKGQEEQIGLSWRNQYEATVINLMLRSDEDIKRLLQTGVNGEASVIIITPYKGQMELLLEQVQLPKGSKASIAINTVDAFQGQEGDVVIVSTVRTKKVGFVNDAERINVALTRAKRVLRVVGELSFFQLLAWKTPLRALAHHAVEFDLVRKSKISRRRHCPPDWTAPTAWSILLTQRFHECIKEMPNETEKNYCLNTLFALATRDLPSLTGGVVRETSGWKMSCFNDMFGRQLGVVWVARTGASKPIIEGHFAGKRGAALQFQQLQCHRIPQGSRAPKKDMSGFLPDEDRGPEVGSSFVPCWPLDNSIQNILLSQTCDKVPFSLLELDNEQKTVASSPTPLLIESRSGTGKTLVLLQHAALTTRHDQERPACFVTVSPRLKEELNKKYDELQPALFSDLPPTEFFTFRGLLDVLVELFHVQDFKDHSVCTLAGFYAERSSHNRSLLEPQLVQNEIGGVIMGSLDAATRRRPLTLVEYLENKRSNIANNSLEGERLRKSVYEEYRNYCAWKISNDKYDLADLVLRLLDRELPQFFSSVYLDEVQDLSHAAIYLICHIGGRETHHWVCAGDPAQMISPGCSFTFDGLKQTLLSVSSGIESKLRTVHHLVVNYRTTKDILVMANTILDRAKRTFPGSIEYALPERAVKDLGLRVVTCNKDDAMRTEVKFGGNQVFIYSPSDSASIPASAKHWLNDHPFILSSLDSKGLEFDDVVVAFHIERKYWDLSRKHESTLRMLRELYVAVTRAQRRVVILIETGNDKMKGFFRELECEEMPAESILQEFNRDTTKDEWHRRGMEFLESERFEIAASCFTRSEQPGWACLATAKAHLSIGLIPDAEASLKQAAYAFYEGHFFDRVLDILRELLKISRSWDHSLNEMFSSSLTQMPTYLSKVHIIQFHLKQDRWQLIRCSDLCNPTLSDIFYAYRYQKEFKAILLRATDIERLEIEPILPWAHADYHFDQGNHMEALRISLVYGYFPQAAMCTERLLSDRSWRMATENCLAIIGLWRPHTAQVGALDNAELSLMLGLFSSPKQTAARSGAECVRLFGRDVVRDAFEKAKLDVVELLVFKDRALNEDVLNVLQRRYDPNLCKVVEILVENGSSGLASEFARRRKWSNDDYMRLTLVMRERPKWLLQELMSRHLLAAVGQMIHCSSKLSGDNKERYTMDVRGCFSEKLVPQPRPLSLMDVFTAEGPCMELRQRGMYIELAFLYAHLGFYHIAARQSVNALKNIGPRSLGPMRLLWEEMINTRTKHTAPSQPVLLMNLLKACREEVNYKEKTRVVEDKAKVSKEATEVDEEAKKAEAVKVDAEAKKTQIKATKVEAEAKKEETKKEEAEAKKAEKELVEISSDKWSVAFSLEWVVKDGPVDVFHLLKEFGPVIVTYMQMLDTKSNDESLLCSLIGHQELLTERMVQQLTLLERKPKQKQKGKKKDAAPKVDVASSTLVLPPTTSNTSKVGNNKKQPAGAGKTKKNNNKKKNRRRG